MMWKVCKIFPHPETRNIRKDPEKSGENEGPLNTKFDKELMSSLLEDLKKSRSGAIAASKASDQLLAELVAKFERAANTSKMEYDAELTAEKHKAKVAMKLARCAADIRLSNQMLRYENAAAASAEASEMMIRALRLESEIASKRFSDEVESRFVIERFTSSINLDLAIESAEAKYESAVCIAMTMAEAAQKYEIELAAKKVEDGVNARVAAEQLEWCIAAKSAKLEQDGMLNTMKLEYEMASIAASNAFELSLETLRFRTQLATHFAIKQFDTQILLERSEFEIAAKISERANAVTLANQQYKYETAANAATEAYRSSMVVLRQDSQAIIDAFNAEMVAKDLKYVVAKLSAERLEKQILADRLEQTAASAQKESELLLSMCGNVAHDLKSPLHTLALSIESLRSLDNNTTSSGSSEELLNTLESACGFMRCAISRTIDFTGANSSVGLTPCKTSFKLLTSLNTPIKWMRSMLPVDGGISLVLEPLPAGVVGIISDQTWFEENLLCLLSNGVKYSSKGAVCVAAAVRQGVLRVTVEDHGIGIDAESRANLFAQISQAQRMTVGGSGLGLYSLSKRSEAIGGACGVDGRSDGQPGSSFWFEVPYIAEPPSHSVSTKSEPETLSARCLELPESLQSMRLVPGSGSPSLHVLVVDDSIAVVKILVTKLTSCGHIVVTAKDGAEGLQKMITMSKELDLVIMDLQMPVMDGIEATRQYRAWESESDTSESPVTGGESRRKRLPIICSSANCAGKTMMTAVAAGVDSFLPKPFDMAALSFALTEATDSVEPSCRSARGSEEMRESSPVTPSTSQRLS